MGFGGCWAVFTWCHKEIYDVCVCVSGQKAAVDCSLQPGADSPGQTGETEEIQGETQLLVTKSKPCSSVARRQKVQQHRDGCRSGRMRTHRGWLDAFCLWFTEPSQVKGFDQLAVKRPNGTSHCMAEWRVQRLSVACLLIIISCCAWHPIVSKIPCSHRNWKQTMLFFRVSHAKLNPSSW